MPRPSKNSFRSSPLAASLTIHAVLVVLMLTLPARFGGEKPEPEPLDIVFYKPEVVERPVVAPPPEPLRAEPEPQPDPEPEPPPEIAKVEPPRVEPPRELPKPVARKQPPPRPHVEPEPEPRREVRTAVLNTPRAEPAAAPQPRRVARTGGFGTVDTVRDAPVGRPDTRVVASGSFGTGEVTVPRQGQRPRGGAVISTSFDAAAEAAPSTAGPATGSVKQGGFGRGEAAAPQPRQRTRPAEKPDTPVAIVSKPKPVYTERARELRIEGEVVLEVMFPASGRLRVLRVLGGLGHGLDEAAIEAAEKIEFEPARRGGRPVDHTATLRVVFQLA